jgi:hypothetical protein
MNFADLIEGIEAPDIGGEIIDTGGADFTGVEFETEEPGEIILDFSGQPLKFEEFTTGDFDFEDLEPGDLEDSELITSPIKEDEEEEEEEKE